MIDMVKGQRNNILDICVTVLAAIGFVGMLFGWINDDMKVMLVSIPLFAVGLNQVIDYFYYYSRR
jgi:hypothetical protein